jgi:hypothetical protein
MSAVMISTRAIDLRSSPTARFGASCRRPELTFPTLEC